MVDIKTNDILAIEALVRWEHRDWGLIAPDEFISLAEEMGLISEVGDWVLREVCKCQVEWRNKGIQGVNVCVNFSPLQFLQQDFVDNVINIIKGFKLHPSFLTVEITENILIDKTDKVIDDINKLKSYGMKVSLDDFGTGYSSLSYLDSFEIDTLKIDGCFVRKATTDNRNLAIIKSLVNLSKELNIKVVAEGIETWQQLSLLKELSCIAGQGYIYAKPAPKEEIENLLIKGKCIPKVDGKDLVKPFKERRKFFRVQFHLPLQADMTIVEVKGRLVNVGKTKVLVSNIGPGGLCFISDIRLPVERDLILSFTTELLQNEIALSGYTVWSRELEDNLYEYGVEFTIDEGSRTELTGILNQIQIKMKKALVFSEGDFTTKNAYTYFKQKDCNRD